MCQSFISVSLASRASLITDILHDDNNAKGSRFGFLCQISTNFCTHVFAAAQKMMQNHLEFPPEADSSNITCLQIRKQEEEIKVV